MDEQPRLPGYRVTGVAGVGGSGAVWAAQAPDGERVVIRLLRADTTSERAVLARRCAAVQRASHPAVARLRERLDLPGGQVALVSTLVDGPTLATTHTARHGLGAAECLTLAHTLLEAVARLHEEGVVHGDVAPANVVLIPDGVRPAPQPTGPETVRPVLVDLMALPGRERGTPGFSAPELLGGAAPGTAADVYAIAMTAVWAAAPTERHLVRDRLSDLLEQDPARRPSASTAARALSDGTAPIRPAESEALAAATLRERAARAATRRVPARRPRRRGRHRQRRSTPMVIGLIVVGLLVTAAGTGWVVRGHRPEPRALASATDAAEMLEARVMQLTATRDEALRMGDATLLATVTVPGSAAAADDAAVLQSLQQADERVEGLASDITDIRIIGVDAAQAQVQAVLTQSAHVRSNAAGTVRPVPAQGPRCSDLLLARHEGQWRVMHVAPCA